MSRPGKRTTAAWRRSLPSPRIATDASAAGFRRDLLGSGRLQGHGGDDAARIARGDWPNTASSLLASPSIVAPRAARSARVRTPGANAMSSGPGAVTEAVTSASEPTSTSQPSGPTTATALPNASVAELPGVGHFLPSDAPAQFADAIPTWHRAKLGSDLVEVPAMLRSVGRR